MQQTPQWIRSPVDTDAAVIAFRRSFQATGAVKAATLHVTSIGVYVPWLNGHRVGQQVLAPGYTSYHNRVQYQSYDVTPLLQEENLLQVQVGKGWGVYWPAVKWSSKKDFYYDHVSLIAWLEITYTDGRCQTIVTDPQWDVTGTQILSAGLYQGETVDLTAPVTTLGKALPDPKDTALVPQVGEWILEQEQFAPVELIRTPKGERVIDFGQNITGYVQLKIQGRRGDRVVIHHAEVLDKDGNFYKENMRSAQNENVFVLSGGEDLFKPQFSFQGFRYIRLEEYPFENVDLSGFRAIVVHSQLTRTGNFHCGNEKINQLYHNIVWGQKGNYLDIPTDCPQRDERLGWTGDAQAFCRTGAINFNISRFMHKGLQDMALDQRADGAINGVIPQSIQTLYSAAWGDAACIVPWEMYLAYGDLEKLREHFPMMKKWVQYIHGFGPEEYLWLDGQHFGDWLAMDAGEDSYKGATSEDLIASAFFAHSTGLVIAAGEALGEDVEEYRILRSQVIRAFRETFMENGLPKEEIIRGGVSRGKGMTQTGLTLILHFGLCEEAERPGLTAALVQLIRKDGNRMSTGFVGTPYLLHVLSNNGRTDLAYTLLMQEKSPSWLYSVNHGATTMWEHWNGIKEDGSFWSADMNSFNHYAYGAVFDWIFGVAAGIQPVAEKPGYKHFLLNPHPDKCLGWLDTSLDSVSGKLSARWYYKADKVYYEFTVPQGATADLLLPSGFTQRLTGGTWHFAE